ncbi:13534_t:CDS:2 [Funneliformis geosporum]|uniref:13534_t:CDS:1 n=1 Tax=Funneliformis geosporum TaxID=1117311 RepID=A0A9W4SAY2_9GLOM|nr:13534_t:CDS:2 [Funneliformis geosporum]
MDLLAVVAKYLLEKQGSSIGKEDVKNILEDLKERKLYRSRSEVISHTTLESKISQLCYFMIGYQDGSRKNFIFSPLGKLYLDNFYTSAINRSYVFLTLLFSIQYPHPHSTSPNYQLFPFRMIFKLLTDSRLGNMLYNYEIFMFVMRTRSNDLATYENLIQEILKYRSKNDGEIEELIKDNQHEYKNTNPTKRTYIKKAITINSNYLNFFDEKPIQLDDPNSLKIENVKLIYSKLPNNLLDYGVVDKENKKDRELFEIPRLIVSHSQNIETGSSKQFEEVIEKAMNLFYDVKAQRISGAGNTDIECLYILSEKDKQKFNVDAKSTAKKLIQINPGRLKQHIAKTNARYCIVITPEYTPSAIKDIQGENIGIHEIIDNNYGEDISQKVYDLTFKTYGSGNGGGVAKREQVKCFNNLEYVMVKKISRIVYTDKSPYEKKIDLFNFLKDLDLGELEEGKNKKINLLLLGRVYNELAKQNLREYKKLEGDSQNEIK